MQEGGGSPQRIMQDDCLNSNETINQTVLEAAGTKHTRPQKSNSLDYSYFERNADGEPIKFIQHHETHPHKKRNPHEHEVDMREATIGCLIDGTFHKLRKDRE